MHARTHNPLVAVFLLRLEFSEKAILNLKMTRLRTHWGESLWCSDAKDKAHMLAADSEGNPALRMAQIFFEV